MDNKVNYYVSFLCPPVTYNNIINKCTLH